jgi:hypothetical protein
LITRFGSTEFGGYRADTKRDGFEGLAAFTASAFRNFKSKTILDFDNFNGALLKDGLVERRFGVAAMRRINFRRAESARPH